MTYIHQTWYVLADGTHGDPNQVSPDKDGVLRHENGIAVSYSENGVPKSIGVDPKAEKEMKPEEPKKNYITREAKASKTK